MTTNKQIRALTASTTGVIAEARSIHNTTPVATAALGRALTAGLLMGSMVKSGDRVGLRIIGNGPLDRIIVESNQYGEVRGFVGKPRVETSLNNQNKLDVASAIGQGQLYVRKVTGLKEPYEGNVPLISGEIGEDLTYYFTKSEQIPSSVGLGVLVNPDHSVKAAGGFIIQLLPEASEETIQQLENNLNLIRSVSRLIDQGSTPEDLLEKLLQGFDYRILATRDISYKCHCNREMIKKLMLGLGEEELEATLEQEDEVEIECHFCGTEYIFNEKEVKEVLGNAKS